MEINISAYQYYTGIDISDLAIQRSIDKCKKNTIRNLKNEYFVSDISKYTPYKKYSVILFRESLYYIRSNFKISKILDRYADYLDENGVFLVRICNRDKYKGIIKLIEKKFNVLERDLPKNIGTIVIVFNK